MTNALFQFQHLAQQPSQPKVSVYPVYEALKSYKTRSFQSSWYKKFDWLEYDVRRDAAFCFCCRKYAKTGNSSPFVATGYRKWSSALESGIKGFRKHEFSESHQLCYDAWNKKQRIESGELKSIADKLCPNANEIAKENKEYLMILFKCVVVYD